MDSKIFFKHFPFFALAYVLMMMTDDSPHSIAIISSSFFYFSFLMSITKWIFNNFFLFIDELIGCYDL